MTLVSVTRLRLRSPRFLPAFAVRTRGSTRQIARSPGFVARCFAFEGISAYWTITAWHEDAAMRHFGNSGEHGRAMPKLLDWCDEASVVHWLQDDVALPSLGEAVRRMVEQGRLSKVRRPSARHDAGLEALRSLTPSPGPELRPKH